MKTGQLHSEPMQDRTTANDGNHQPGTLDFPQKVDSVKSKLLTS